MDRRPRPLPERTRWPFLAIAAVAASMAATNVQAGGYRAPRTSFGAPSLQGTWTNLSLTQLEPPAGVTALTLDDRQAEAIEQRIQRDRAGRPERMEFLFPDAALARIDGHARSSWIVEPADGHLPYTPEAAAELKRREASVKTAFDNPEDRDISERCLLPLVGMEAPILNLPFTANYQIVQTPQEVAIYFEGNHEMRFIRLNGRHPPKDVRFWMGDSIGHWEKDVLVVETSNFRPDEFYRLDYLLSADAKVTERFERISATELRYSFSVDDPKTYTRTWRGEMPFRATRERMYEAACHEGNYAVRNALEGARWVESGARGPR